MITIELTPEEADMALQSWKTALRAVAKRIERSTAGTPASRMAMHDERICESLILKLADAGVPAFEVADTDD